MLILISKPFDQSNLFQLTLDGEGAPTTTFNAPLTEARYRFGGLKQRTTYTATVSTTAIHSCNRKNIRLSHAIRSIIVL